MGEVGRRVVSDPGFTRAGIIGTGALMVLNYFPYLGTCPSEMSSIHTPNLHHVGYFQIARDHYA